jgi:hypothetical protein
VNESTKKELPAKPMSLLEREPFLAEERTEAEFEEYVHINNCDSLIENVDFSADVIVA